MSRPTREKVLFVRVTASEATKVAKAAKQRGLATAAYVRMIVLAALQARSA